MAVAVPRLQARPPPSAQRFPAPTSAEPPRNRAPSSAATAYCNKYLEAEFSSGLLLYSIIRSGFLMSWFARRCQLCFRVGDRKCFLQPKRFFAQRVTPEVTCVLKPYVQPQGEA